MTEEKLKYYLSSLRFNVYLAKTNNDFDKAYLLYKVNIELSPSPKQAYLKDTQSLHTEANLAKELAFPHTGIQ